MPTAVDGVDVFLTKDLDCDGQDALGHGRTRVITPEPMHGERQTVGDAQRVLVAIPPNLL